MDPVYLAGNGYIVTVLGRLHTGCFTDRWSCSQRFSFFTRQEKQRVEGCGHRTMANYREKQRQVINLNIFTRHPERRSKNDRSIEGRLGGGYFARRHAERRGVSPAVEAACGRNDRASVSDIPSGAE